MASAYAREVGPACTAIKSVLPTDMGRIVPRNAVVETAVGAITFLANVTVPPVTPDRCAMIYVHWVNTAKNASRNVVVKMAGPAVH